MIHTDKNSWWSRSSNTVLKQTREYESLMEKSFNDFIKSMQAKLEQATFEYKERYPLLAENNIDYVLEKVSNSLQSYVAYRSATGWGYPDKLLRYYELCQIIGSDTPPELGEKVGFKNDYNIKQPSQYRLYSYMVGNQEFISDEFYDALNGFNYFGPELDENDWIENADNYLNIFKEFFRDHAFDLILLIHDIFSSNEFAQQHIKAAFKKLTESYPSRNTRWLTDTLPEPDQVHDRLFRNGPASTKNSRKIAAVVS